MRLEYWNNTNPPVAELEGANIMIPAVRYQYKVQSKVALKNTGTSIIYWRFLPKLDNRKKWKRWINVQPSSGLVLPGTQQDIQVVVMVDKATSNGILNGTEFLDDTLILRVENGLDYYIKVSGN